MKKLILIIILGFFSSTGAFAVTVSSLYQADVMISAQTDEERQAAAIKGLVQVLIKVSGNPQIEKNPIIKAGLKKSDYYIQEFTYGTATETSWQYAVKIRYDKDEVNRLLRKAGVSYWGEVRPLILVWLIITDEQHSTEIIGNESPGGILSAMKELGKKFGLPLIFPVMDMADTSRVSSNDVSAMRASVIKEAGKRYAADAYLVGNITGTSKWPESHWQLFLDEDEWEWNISDKTNNAIITDILNEVSQTLAKHYAVKITDTPPTSLKLIVSNIKEQEDYLQLMAYLKQLTLVQQVDFSQIEGDTVELDVVIHGTLAAFQKNAAIGQHLILKSQDIANKKLIYQWAY